MQTYKLAKIIGGKGNFAVVSGHLELRENFDDYAVLGSNVFDWIKQSYGPDAILPRNNDEFVSAAFRGIKIALQELRVDNLKVVIDELHFLIVDTKEAGIALAAYQLSFQLVTGAPKFDVVDVNVLEQFGKKL